MMPSSRSSRVAIGFKFLLALLALGDYEKVCEVPCFMRRRQTGRSKFSFWDVVTYVRHLFYLSARSGEAGRLLRFCLVGASAFVLYESALYVLTDRLLWHYLVSALVGWSVAFLWNFALNERLTFGVPPGDMRTVLRRGMKYLGVKAVGVGLHLVVLAALTEVVGLNYLLSAAVAVALVVGWNYTASASVVWTTGSAEAWHRVSP
jgi:putative flippase GtrA